jgi:hypothetical protein
MVEWKRDTKKESFDGGRTSAVSITWIFRQPGTFPLSAE